MQVVGKSLGQGRVTRGIPLACAEAEPALRPSGTISVITATLNAAATHQDCLHAVQMVRHRRRAVRRTSGGCPGIDAAVPHALNAPRMRGQRIRGFNATWKIPVDPLRSPADQRVTN